jgi:hypothetical protein
MTKPICDKCKKEITNETIYPRYRVMRNDEFKLKRNYLGQAIGNGEYFLHKNCVITE